MTDDEIIHWETGLFIEPQHFQTLQRQALGRTIAERRLLMPFPYGVVRAELDNDRLTLAAGSSVFFKRLQVVMESGLVVDSEKNATLAPLDLKNFKKGGTYTIYLAVSTGAAAAEDDGKKPEVSQSGMKGRFKKIWREVSDEIEGTHVTSIPTRVVDACLIGVGEYDPAPDPSFWESMPMMRVILSDPPQIDRHFAPPCLFLSGCKDLKDLVIKIEQRAAAWMGYIVANLNLPDSAQTRNDVREMQKYQAVLSHRAALTHALIAESLTAYDAYGLCLQLLAAVCGSELSESNNELVSKYRHDKPWPAFNDLLKALTFALPEATNPPREYELDWLGTDNEYVQACAFGDAGLVSKGWEGVLAVGADSQLVLDQVLRSANIAVGAPLPLKFMERNQFIKMDFVSSTEVLKPIPGVRVTSFHRLTIETASEGWRAVTTSGQLGIRYANETSTGKTRLKFRLYLKPPAAEPVK